MVKFLFSVHTITEAKQSNRQGGARAVDLPARSFELAHPGVAPPQPRRLCNARRLFVYLSVRPSVCLLATLCKN